MLSIILIYILLIGLGAPINQIHGTLQAQWRVYQYTIEREGVVR